MKKLNKVAMLFASAALAAPVAALAAAHVGMAPKTIDNWRNVPFLLIRPAIPNRKADTEGGEGEQQQPQAKLQP